MLNYDRKQVEDIEAVAEEFARAAAWQSALADIEDAIEVSGEYPGPADRDEQDSEADEAHPDWTEIQLAFDEFRRRVRGARVAGANLLVRMAAVVDPSARTHGPAR